MMQTRKTVVFAMSVAALLLVMTSLANAGVFSNIYVYGDSLSDTGNIYAASGNTIPPSSLYFNGRFSNGPLAVEYLANSLSSPLTSFAWGGATTGVGNSGDGGTQTALGTAFLPLIQLPGMGTELALTGGTLTKVPTSLFVVWGGSDDYISGGTVTQGVADMVGIVDYLLSKGAMHILVPGMPDLSLTPEYYGVSSAQTFSQNFNAGLQASLPAGVIYFDTYGFMHKVVNNPGAYGFTDVTDACLAACTSPSDASKFLFWDTLHPTTAADQILGAEFQHAVVPEPSTFLMLGTGIAGLAGVLRRKMSA